MATIAPTQPTITSPPPSRTPPLHRITVDEYEQFIAAGALEDPGRVELIDGYMGDKIGKNAEHSYATKETIKALDRRLPAGRTSRKEEPVWIPAFDEPEPDVAIVRGSDADYRHRIPTPADVALLVPPRGVDCPEAAEVDTRPGLSRIRRTRLIPASPRSRLAMPAHVCLRDA